MMARRRYLLGNIAGMWRTNSKLVRAFGERIVWTMP